MMDYRDGGWASGAWIGMSLMMLVSLGVLVALTVWIVRIALGPSRGNEMRSPPRSRADALVAERYARGEIDEEEFQRRRDQLHEAMN